MTVPNLLRPGGRLLLAWRGRGDCRRAVLQRLGWQVTDVYPDNDVSAYSGKKRPEWERLNADIHDGLIDAIACWHVHRLARSARPPRRASPTAASAATATPTTGPAPSMRPE